MAKSFVIPYVQAVHNFFQQLFEGDDKKQPKNTNKGKIGIFKHIITWRDNGGKTDDEEVHEQTVQTDNEEHLRGETVSIAALHFGLHSFDMGLPMLRIGYPERRFVLESLQQLLDHIFVVEVEVELEYVENDEDVQLVGDGQDYWAQHVENAVLGGDWEVGEDAAGVVGDPQHHHDYGLKPVLDHACRAVVEKLEFFVLFVDVGAGLAV